jgi:hypothetical protein
MSELGENGDNYFIRLLKSFKGKIVQRVPDDLRACEFECRKLQCLMGDWEKCEKRLHSKAKSQEHS